MQVFIWPCIIIRKGEEGRLSLLTYCTWHERLNIKDDRFFSHIKGIGNQVGINDILEEKREQISQKDFCHQLT